MINFLGISLIVAAVITLVVYAMICRARRKTPIEYPRNYSNAWKTSSKLIDESRFTVVQLTQQELIELEADLTNVSEDKP